MRPHRFNSGEAIPLARLPVRASDLTGQRFGRLEAIEPVKLPDARTRNTHWRCRCDCGSEIVAISNNLRRALTRSCGCLQRELAAERRTTHGHSRGRDGISTPFCDTYQTWANMLKRCRDTTDANYGGRGITVCARWHDFAAFCADMGPKPARHFTIERLDNAGPYEPLNCIWATRTQQARNTRRTRWLRVAGLKRRTHHWAALIGIRTATLHNRLRRGWTPQEAIQPLGYRRGTPMRFDHVQGPQEC